MKMQNYVWITSIVAEFGSPDKAKVVAREFVRRAGKLYYRQYADAHGRPARGAGRLFNPMKYAIGQNPCRAGLESIGLK